MFTTKETNSIKVSRKVFMTGHLTWAILYVPVKRTRITTRGIRRTGHAHATSAAARCGGATRLLDPENYRRPLFGNPTDNDAPGIVSASPVATALSRN